MRRILLAVAACALASATPAAAQYVEPTAPRPPEPPAAPSEAEEIQPEAPVPEGDRHRGFFFRADLGGGYLGSSARMSLDGRMTSVSIEGGAFSFSLAAGGAIIENVVVAAEGWMISASDPLRVALGTSSRVSDSSLDLFGMGVQVTGYLPDLNAYVSITPSLSIMSLREGYTTVDTRDGFGLKVGVGWEGRIGGSWGLGVAGQFFYGSNEDAGAPGVTWSSLGGALAFTATYN
ncbi:MAG TPA: hypothetical protein VFM53_07995 [Anaeromyxobacteraceae bacterium]|nr:hypothetical protein [Anaeromyxobacteraceae bacterium]